MRRYTKRTRQRDKKKEVRSTSQGPGNRGNLSESRKDFDSWKQVCHQWQRRLAQSVWG